MVTLSKDNIKEIAGQLDRGFIAYVNKETGELVFVPDTDQFYGMEVEGWEKELAKLKKGKKKFLEIEKMKSHDSFRIMEDFARQVEDVSIRKSILEALSRRKPFSHFKDAIDNSGDYREKWFAFKEQHLIEWVEEQLKEIQPDS